MIPHSEWKWYGYAGHFIGGKNCAYHLCTRVGPFLISTLGDYYPYGEGGKRFTLGAADDSWFETFVLLCDGEDENGDPILTSSSEIDSERYAESIDAERGHHRFCDEYARNSDPRKH